MGANHDNRIVGEPASSQGPVRTAKTCYFNNGIVAILMADRTVAYGVYAPRQWARVAEGIKH